MHAAAWVLMTAAHACEQRPFAERVAEVRRGPSRKVLVTGAAGFIGSHVADYAANMLGFRVIAIDDLSGGSPVNVPPNVKFMELDLKDPDRVDLLFSEYGPFDYIYHLAAYAAEGLSHFIRRYNYRNNLEASVSLINQAVMSKACKAFVFTSSIAAFGTPERLPLVENATPHPEDPYGISKLAVELDLRAAKQMFGLDFVIFRPHNVYGPKQNLADRFRNVIGIFFNEIMHGEPMTIFGDGSQRRSFSYIDDVAPLIAIAPEVPAARQEAFFVGGDRDYSVMELSRASAKAMGVPHNVRLLDRRNEVNFSYASHDKARCFFNPEPPVPLETGLGRTAAWAKLRGKTAPTGYQAIELCAKLPPSWLPALPACRHAARDYRPRHWIPQRSTYAKAERMRSSKVDVKVFAVYWPQWHATPMNDYWFGPDYTDWDLLCNNVMQDGGTNKYGRDLLLPRPQPEGFGWYNLTADKDVRRRQALLAKEYGIHGFVYYHYWFSRPARWGRGQSWNGGDVGADMDESLMRLLDEADGEPNIPFYFVWANEEFIWKWTQWTKGRVGKLKPGSTQVPVSYPESGWRPHFDYLLRFFRHQNYHKIGGKPVLATFMPEPPPPVRMFELWQQWAVEAGFPGLYLLQWFHGKQGHKQQMDWNNNSFAPWADAVQDFGWSSLFGDRRQVGWRHTGSDKWYHGIIADFDNTPRMGTRASISGGLTPERGGPPAFEKGLDMLMRSTLTHAKIAKQNETLLMVVAFNEWTEQAVLEPTDAYGTGYLDALRSVLQRHGQYRYTGQEGLWKEAHGPPVTQLTACAQPALPRGPRRTRPYNYKEPASEPGGRRGGNHRGRVKATAKDQKEARRSW